MRSQCEYLTEGWITMILEFCAENATNIAAAVKKGANRIELCDNLAVGGTTPSLAVVEYVVDYCHKHDVSVVTMLRHRGGDFDYDATDVDILLAELGYLLQTETDGIVFGALKKGRLDKALIETVKVACDQYNKDVVMHMAFDQLSRQDQFEAIDWLADIGVTRILTHGGAEGTSVLDNVDHLCMLRDYANGRLTIMPGGGINKENLVLLHEKVKLAEYHGTKIVG